MTLGCGMIPIGDDVMGRAVFVVAVGTTLLAGRAGADSIPAASIAAPDSEMTGSSFELMWDAPAECPQSDAIKSEVLRLAGGSANYSRRIKVRAVVRPNPVDSWTLVLDVELDGETGERVLSGRSCQSVSDAAALTLALLLNPDISRASDPGSQARGRPRSTQTWLMGAGVGLQKGVLRDVSPALALSLGVATGRVSVRLMPSYTPAQSISLPGRPDLGGRVWATTVDLLGCWTLADGRGILAPCLGYDLFVAHGRGVGVLRPRDQTVYWSAAEIGLITGMHLSRNMSFVLSGLGFLSMNRPALYLDDAGTVTRPARFGIRAFAAIELTFR